VYLLQVISQVNNDGTLSSSTTDEVERVLLARCGNDSRRDPIFNDSRTDSIFNDSRTSIFNDSRTDSIFNNSMRVYMECVDTVERIAGQLRVNFSIAQRSVCFDYCIS